MLRLAAVLLLLALSMAGCAGSPDDTAAEEGGTNGDEGGATGAVTSIAAPVWQPGQWWEWETTFTDGTRDETFCSIVSPFQGAADGPYLVTEQDGMAKEAAAFGHPLLGDIRANDLAMSSWGDAPWSVLSFPLTDGKAWQATIPNVAWDVFLPADTVDAAFTATFRDAPVGEAPVVAIVAKAQDLTLLEAEYDPASGWFRTFTIYDVDAGQDPLEVSWRAKSTGLNYTGPYFDHSAELLVAFDDPVGFNDVPVANGGQPYTQAPQPHHTFTMQAGTTLYGYIGAATVAGARTVVLIDPANQERHVAPTDAPEGEEFLFIDEPGQAGEWRIVTGGAGGFSGGFAELFEVTLGQGSMGMA